MDRTIRCNKVDAVRLYALYTFNLLLLKGQRCVGDVPLETFRAQVERGGTFSPFYLIFNNGFKYKIGFCLPAIKRNANTTVGCKPIVIYMHSAVGFNPFQRKK